MREPTVSSKIPLAVLNAWPTICMAALKPVKASATFVPVSPKPLSAFLLLAMSLWNLAESFATNLTPVSFSSAISLHPIVARGDGLRVHLDAVRGDGHGLIASLKVQESMERIARPSCSEHPLHFHREHHARLRDRPGEKITASVERPESGPPRMRWIPPRPRRARPPPA